MLTFRRFTALFFLLLLFLNLYSIFLAGEGEFILKWRFHIMLGIIILYMTISVILAFFPCSGFHHPVFCHGQEGRKWVALTFDDGPDKTRTPVLLRHLAKHNVPATFFIVGSKIKGNEELISEICRQGHTLGNHSYSHSSWFDFFASKRMETEITTTCHLIEQVTGKRPRWFRPPFGVINPMLSRALTRLNLDVVCWSVRSFDTINKDNNRLLLRIIQGLKPGSVILLHDQASFSNDMLDRLITGILHEGYEIMPLEQLINLPPYA